MESARGQTALTLCGVEGGQLATVVGLTKRGSPPPDMMRVASSFALLGALLVALVLQRLLGG